MLALLLSLILLPQAPPDLGTRKAGVDWPGFLGPDHDSKSPEKGLKWPAEGPRVVWQRPDSHTLRSENVQGMGPLFGNVSALVEHLAAA